MEPDSVMRRSFALRATVAALLVQFALTAALIYLSSGLGPWVGELRRGGGEAVAGAGTLVLLLVLVAPVTRGHRWAIVAATLVQALLVGGILPFFMESFARPARWASWLLNTTYLIVGIGAIAFGAIAAAEAFGRSTPSRLRSGGAFSWQAVVAVALVALWAGMATLGGAIALRGEADTAVAAVPDAVISLPMQDVKFLMQPLRIRAGERTAVVLVNRDPYEHSFDVDPLGIHVAIPGRSTTIATIPPQRPGRIPYYCDVVGHEEAGMTGTILVE